MPETKFHCQGRHYQLQWLLALMAVLAMPTRSRAEMPQKREAMSRARRSLELSWMETSAEATDITADPAAPLVAAEIPRLKQYDLGRVVRPPDPKPSASSTKRLSTLLLGKHAPLALETIIPQCSWESAAVLAALLLAAISPIGIKQGWRAFVVVLVYVTCLTLLKILVKLTLRCGLPYPYTITTAHVLVTAVVASCCDQPDLKEALRVLPISLANSGALAFSNTALAISGVAFVSMLSCCTPASTCAVQILTGRKEAAWQTGAAVLLVCTGGMLCIKGEKEFCLAAVVLTVMSSACRSMKCIWQHDQLQMALSPYRLVAWSGIWSMVLILPLAAYYEGAQGVLHLISASSEAKAAALASTLVAVMLNMVQCSALQYLGPLIQHVVGNLQLILAIVLASAWLHEEVTLLQWEGVLVLVLGTMVVKAGPEPAQGAADGCGCRRA